jgi:hypothetical protein
VGKEGREGRKEGGRQRGSPLLHTHKFLGVASNQLLRKNLILMNE